MKNYIALFAIFAALLIAGIRVSHAGPVHAGPVHAAKATFQNQSQYPVKVQLASDCARTTSPETLVVAPNSTTTVTWKAINTGQCYYSPKFATAKFAGMTVQWMAASGILVGQQEAGFSKPIAVDGYLNPQVTITEDSVFQIRGEAALLGSNL